jgi:site-specific DNA recombinase
MSFSKPSPLLPRNGHTLVVGIVARISGCANQKEMSLDDQIDHAKAVVADLYDGPVEYRPIATKGKGERRDRPELVQMEVMIRSRELDLLIAEDLGRIVRGTAASDFCGLAVDHGIRVLAPNDCVDTNNESWEADVISACRDHVGHNSHTSKRLKQKLMNRFIKHGGATPLIVYGYIKPPGAKTYTDWQKDPEATPVYQEWFRMLRETKNCSTVADWLNDQGIPLGEYARRETWDGKMVRRITKNPLLKGCPGRGFNHTVKRHELGRRITELNPDGPRYVEFTHLAHVESDLWDEVNAQITSANKGKGRKPVHGVDPLYRVPRKRTKFPGQHATCHYCGRNYVWGGNGIPGDMICTGARDRKCWNSIGLSGDLVAKKVAVLIADELLKLDGFEDQFRELVKAARDEAGGNTKTERERLDADIQALSNQRENITEAIAKFGVLDSFEAKLRDISEKENGLLRRRRVLDRLKTRSLDLPSSPTELRKLFDDKFRHLATSSPEFGDLLRQIVPEFRVHLVRLCDGGHLEPRAQITLNLAGLSPDARYVSGFEAMLSREVTIDLFEPPQREQIREEAVRMEADGVQQREIAASFPQKVTQPAVTNALKLNRLMRSRGLDTPYEFMEAPPEDYKKLRRHRNKHYQFKPMSGYVPPPI